METHHISVNEDLIDAFSRATGNDLYDKKFVDLVCLVTQLLCVRLVKKLLQLMPPEIFLAMKEKLPHYYLHVYLNEQFHFNLQDLVKEKIRIR